MKKHRSTIAIVIAIVGRSSAVFLTTAKNNRTKNSKLKDEKLKTQDRTQGFSKFGKIHILQPYE